MIVNLNTDDLVSLNNAEFKFYFKYGEEVMPIDNNTHYVMAQTTTCIIKNTYNEIVAFGKTFCSPSDNYIKDEGRKRALTRALENGLYVKSERTKFWEVYFKNVNSPRRLRRTK